MINPKEKVLPNTIVKYVYWYLHDKLQELERQTFQDGDIQYHSICVFDYKHTIQVGCSASVTTDGKVTETHGWPVVDFEVSQLQLDTVRVKAKYGLSFFRPMLDVYWKDMLKDFKQPIEHRTDIYEQFAKFDKVFRKEPGRPHIEADLWAREQVYIHRRPKDKVKKEWLSREDVQARALRDPERHFDRIMAPSWLKE